MKKTHIRTALLSGLFAAVVLWGCSNEPQNKEEYIQEYSQFIKEVETEKEQYSEKDWQAKEEQLKHYKQELYQQFESDLSRQEKRDLRRNERRFQQLKNPGSTGLFDGVGKLLEEADKFIENGGISDLGEQLGGELERVLQGEEMQNTLNELKGVLEGDAAAQLEQSLQELNATLSEAEIQAKLEKSLKELEQTLNDEEVKGHVRDAVKDFKKALEEMEAKLEQQPEQRQRNQ